MTREKQGRSYHLGLTPAGERAFRTCHQVFFDWDVLKFERLILKEETALALSHHVTEKERRTEEKESV